MPDQPYHLVIRGGTVATGRGAFAADVAISGENIAAIGHGLPAGAREIDAKGKLVVPGGVDSFESATASAALGGTTSVISFAAQHIGNSLDQVVADYHAAAERGAVIDYAFHMIIADPTEQALKHDVPKLVRSGHATLKVFMTYDRIRVDDEQLLDVLAAAKENGAFVCVHAENHGMITWMVKRLLARGYTAPKYHAVSHPRSGEAEAFNRLISFAAFLDQPVMIFHVSSAEGVDVITRARGQGLKVFAETCPQYLFLTNADLDKPGMDGAKWICSPPMRTAADQAAIWAALERGDLQVISSDHAPYRYDDSGKFVAGPSPNFKQIPNGMPGLHVRMPLLFDAMVSKGRLGLAKFVELTAEAPARIYNLAGKGTIAVGADADIAIWDPNKRVTLTADGMHDRAGYTPYEGREVVGWPETVLCRGRVIVHDGQLLAKPGEGRFLARGAGDAAKGTGRMAPEFDPSRNFGAKLI